MGGTFQPLKGGGAAVALEEIEISILRSLAVQLLELIGPGEPEPAADADPLAALFAADGPTEPPSDPALARLFPDAYGGRARSPRRTPMSCAPGRRSSAGSPRTTCAPASGRTRWRSCAAWTRSPRPVTGWRSWS